MSQKSSRITMQSFVFFQILMLCTGILIAFSVFFYKYVSDILIQREISSLSDLNRTFQEQTDAAVDNMNSVSINLDYSASINSLLQRSAYDFSLVPIEEFADLCTSINGTQVSVEQINIYDYEGNVLQAGALTKHSHYDTDSNSEFFNQIRSTGGSKVISSPYQSKSLLRYTLNQDWNISLYRCLFDSNRNNIGIIETIKSCKSLFKSISSYTSRNKEESLTYVYNEQGVLIYPFETSVQPSNDYYALLSEIDDDSICRSQNLKSPELILSRTSHSTKWTYVTVLSEKKVLAPVYSLMKLLLIVFLFIFLLSTLFSFFLSSRLVQPIHSLEKEIKKTGLNNLDTDSSDSPLHSSIQEIADLGASFYEMRHNLKTSMDDLLEARKEEQRSRTLALQSQINPHFYYNSLASIIALSENEQHEEVTKMCMNLTKLMRYVTDTQELVTIGQELEYLENYLSCMKIRYQSSLNYFIDVDDRIKEQIIPRLLIQPLVENAIKYGIDSEPPWGFAIHGYCKDEGWIIEIMDSGKGFSEEALHLIKSRIQEAQNAIGMPQSHIDGLGTLNVYLRWMLYCGNSMIYELGNSPSGHGIVKIGTTHFLSGKEMSL